MSILISALLASFLASISSALVGSYVIVRRSAYIAGAIAHCILAGIGLAVFLDLAAYASFFAIGVALIAAVIIARCGVRSRTDATLSALWAAGMAIGVTLIAITPDRRGDLMSYLFGNIFLVGARELLTMLALDVVLFLTFGLLRNRFFALAFNSESLSLRGVNVGRLETIFTILVALAVVLLVQVVGVLLAIALLALPAAAAAALTRRFATMQLLAFIFSLFACGAGIFCSYFFDIPAGATIAEISAAIYLAAAIRRLCHRRVKKHFSAAAD